MFYRGFVIAHYVYSKDVIIYNLYIISMCTISNMGIAQNSNMNTKVGVNMQCGSRGNNVYTHFGYRENVNTHFEHNGIAYTPLEHV